MSRTKNNINWVRLAIAVVFGALLSGLLLAQSLSSFITDRDPGLAVSIFPSNGLARADMAFAIMAEQGVEGGQIPLPTDEAIAQAKSAFAKDALTAKAHTILALSQDDEADKRNVAELANQLGRRNLSLQVLLLQNALADEDYERSITALDRILRVHPNYSGEFFPYLAIALANDETIGTFTTLLDGSSPWHSNFLQYASRQNAALPNLAKVRLGVDLTQEGFNDGRLAQFDSSVVSGLVRDGRLAEAQELYQAVIGTNSESLAKGNLGWRSDLPPLDWRFVDESGFRAQTTPEGDGIEVSVRPGKGGVFAERVLPAPTAPFAVKFDYSVSPADRARDIRLLLRCEGEAEPFFDEAFRDDVQSFAINAVPSGCDYLRLALTARAWSGRSKLDIEMQSISIDEAGSQE